MLNHPTAKIYLHVEPTDMRKGFDTLAQLVQIASLQAPFSGAWFLFRSKRGDRLKILYWDLDGYALWYKRLDVGTFEFPQLDSPQPSIEISARQLSLILSGIDLTARQRKTLLPACDSCQFAVIFDSNLQLFSSSCVEQILRRRYHFLNPILPVTRLSSRHGIKKWLRWLTIIEPRRSASSTTVWRSWRSSPS